MTYNYLFVLRNPSFLEVKNSSVEKPVLILLDQTVTRYLNITNRKLLLLYLLQMKIEKILTLIILLAFLFTITQSLPKSRGRFSKKQIAQFKKWMEPQFTIMGIGFGRKHARDPKDLKYVFLLVFGGLGIAVFAESCRRSLRKKKDKLLADIQSGFKDTVAEPSSLTEEQRESILYNITFSALNNIHIKDNDLKEYACKLRSGKSEKITQDMYGLEFKVDDLKGQSKVEGVILFSKDGLRLKLCKVFEGIELSQVLGPFNASIFQGQGNSAQITGQLRKHGQQNRSGTFQMLRD